MVLRMKEELAARKSKRIQEGQILTGPLFNEPLRRVTVRAKDPARFEWNEVTKVARYYLSLDALTRPVQVREQTPPHGKPQ